MLAIDSFRFFFQLLIFNFSLFVIDRSIFDSKKNFFVSKAFHQPIESRD